MSNQFVYQLLKHLALALYPEDITFLNDSKKYTIKEFMESQHLKSKLLPGDLVLTQTPGPIHATIRKVAHWRYDHLALIIDDENMLHIAPPHIRLLSSNVLLMKKRNPLVLRVNISKEERERIRTQLLKDVGERYDYSTALGLSVRVAALKMFEFGKKEKKEILDESKRYICSDLIAYTFMELSPSFKNVCKRNFKKLDISNYQSFSPDDFWRLSELDSSMVSKIHDSPVLDPGVEEKHFSGRLAIANLANGLLLYKRVKNNIKRQKAGTIGKFWIVFKYMFIHNLIPYEKELIAKILPVNTKFIEFVLVLLQVRQYYYDTVIEQPTEIIKKLFPTFFLFSSRLIGHKELDMMVNRLSFIKNFRKPEGGLLDLKNMNFNMIDKLKPAEGLLGSLLKKSKL